MEIWQIDLAWEAVSVLEQLSRKALDAITQSGGRDPSSLRTSKSLSGIHVELREYGYQSIVGIIAKAAAAEQSQKNRPRPYPRRLTCPR